MLSGTLDRRFGRTFAGVSLLLLVAAAALSLFTTPALALSIVEENALPGNPKSEWDINGAGSSNILGFATDISVNRGQTISFKIKTNSRNYRIDIYRLGYYGGAGARKVATIQRTLTTAQSQPSPRTDAATGLVDAGNWAVSASWPVPSAATSGVYVAKLVRQDGTAGSNHIPFVVRDDNGSSALLMQTSDTTWQAYNAWGGNSLYVGSPDGRAYKVSYNRPITNRGGGNGTGPRDYLFDSDYPLLRWLEANGYDVSYMAGVDADRLGGNIRNHDVFISVGHDEYWSGGQRANVEAARDAGVNLAFFSGNEVFWKTRWENSIGGTATPYRTLVCYKETHANTAIDPLDPPTATGTWRDPRFGVDAGRPENALTGTIFTVNDGSVDRITVPEPDGKMRFWRHTNINTQNPGATATLTANALTYEWDEDLDNGARPPGLIRLSSTFDPSTQYLQDYGSNYASAPATHRLTLYREPSGALVFGAGTTRWAWGLDATHDNDSGGSGATATDVRMQQATINLFADMGAFPATIRSGLTRACASTDSAPPTSSMTSPANGASFAPGASIQIAGGAVDTGGGGPCGSVSDPAGKVGGVEISTDGGTTWHPATGRESWSYAWVAPTSGSYTLKSRAVDDSGNRESAGAGVTITVTGSPPPPPPPPTGAQTIFTAQTPTLFENDGSYELGTRFWADRNGQITKVRLYTHQSEGGAHTVRLWNAATGTLVAGPLTWNISPGVAGWKEFALPTVTITANTDYIIAISNGPDRYYAEQVHGLDAVINSGNLHTYVGSGTYSTTLGTMPTSVWNNTNYFRDIVFVPL